MQLVREMLEFSGLGQDRLQLRWVSSSEGQIFADYIKELTEVIRNLGPLDREKSKLALGAMGRTLSSLQVRWLLGNEPLLTTRGNVYQEKLAVEDVHLILGHCSQEEYQRQLLVETLQNGPKTVREMARLTGLPVYSVSVRLNDLERTGQVDLLNYEGSSPVFTMVA